MSTCDDCPTFPLNGGPQGTCVPPPVTGPLCVVPVVIGAVPTPANETCGTPLCVFLQGRCVAGVLTMGYYDGPLAGAVLVGPVGAFTQVKCPEVVRIAGVAAVPPIAVAATTCAADTTVQAADNLSQRVHTAPGTALVVKLCPSTVTGRAVVTACNAAGQTIILQYNTDTIPPTELSRFNVFTGAAEPAGPLVPCAGNQPSLETDTVCVSPGNISRERVRVFNATGPTPVLTATIFYDQVGAVVPAPATFTVGACQLTRDCLTCRAA